MNKWGVGLTSTHKQLQRSGQSRNWPRDLWISSPAPWSLGHGTWRPLNNSLPWTLIVPVVVAFPATDSTRHVYVPASISCTVVIRSDPSACTVIRAVSTGEPSFVQFHLTVITGSFCTLHWSVFVNPFVAWIWFGSGVVITVLTAANTENKNMFHLNNVAWTYVWSSQLYTQLSSADVKFKAEKIQA